MNLKLIYNLDTGPKILVLNFQRHFVISSEVKGFLRRWIFATLFLHAFLRLTQEKLKLNISREITFEDLSKSLQVLLKKVL